MPGAATAPPRVAAVVVNHDAGPALCACLDSLEGQGADPLVVVDNASTDGSTPAAVAAHPATVVVASGRNLGYGAGANRGAAAAAGADYLLVANPDLELAPGVVAGLVAALEADPAAALAGPRLVETDGRRYPSARRFPGPLDAAAHALLALFWPQNRFSRRYRGDDLDRGAGGEPTAVDWVSGACFLARSRAFEELGGFDEGYFMYAEDMDLCWRAGRAGWRVLYVPSVTVTHHQGVSTARHPYQMAVAHHRSALRFAWRTARGWRRAVVVPAAAVLAVRLVAHLGRLTWAGRRPAGGRLGCPSDHGQE